MFKRDPENLDERTSGAVIADGRRAGENENPYLNARRTWNDHVGSVVASRRNWQMISVLSLLIALASIGGVIHIGSQSKYIPYVVEVDSHGRSVSMGPAIASTVDARIVRASIMEFIEDSRLVTLDVALQRKAIFRVYSKLRTSDPATFKMTEWLDGTEDASPFKRAERELVNIEVKSALNESPSSWQIDWVEYSRDRQGSLKEKKSMRAIITVALADSQLLSEKQLNENPLGIYVQDFSWSGVQ